MSVGKLPEGWKNIHLGDVIELKYGKSLAAQVRDGIGYPVFGSNGIVGKHSIPLIKQSGLIVGRKGSYGVVQKSVEPFFPIDTTYYIDELFNQPINFWFYYLSFLPLTKLNRSTTIPGLNRDDAYNLSINLPPLVEQKIIAEKLDTLLAQVDSTKARLEQIPKILKRFRQAVLASALRGELTKKWRIDNKTGQDISSFKASVKKYRFESWVKEQEQKFINKGKQPRNDNWKKKYQEAIISQDISDKDIPDGWLFEPLDGLVYISARIGWKGLKASEYTVKGPLFLSVHSLNYGKEANLEQAYHISEHRYDESPEIKLQNNDILLCKDGAGIGKLSIVKNLNEPATINSSLLLIRGGDFFVPEYLFYFLSGPEMQNLVKERMTGSAVPHLFQRDVKEFVLEVPPLNEQHEIVRRVEQLFAYADTIEKQVNTALSRVNNLTQSILAKAFRGELTAQWREENPDLISGENSAAVLLEKIKAERAASVGKKAPRKKA
ncbi:restriction endonuclease subunit S [Pectobacterium parmentieri]|uniref:restriction endonuclease subunit S n=1 Tax=Pectobacterium parmentieri TaxID=1905730 RepID=UPI0005C4E815